MNIKSFKTGDVITRDQPAVMAILSEDKYGIPEMEEQLLYDEIGEPFVLQGVEHNVIYLKGELYDLKLAMHNPENIDWSEGWEKYKGPALKSKSKFNNPDATSFYAGLVFFLFTCVIMIASDVSNRVFYGFMAFFTLSMVSFTVYLTRLWK